MKVIQCKEITVVPSWVAPMIALITPILPLKSYGYIYSNQKQTRNKEKKMDDTESELKCALEFIQRKIGMESFYAFRDDWFNDHLYEEKRFKLQGLKELIA